MTLVDVLDAAAAELEGVQRRGSGSVIEWSAGGPPFAACAGATADFRLKPAVLRAALGTVDTGPSDRGPDWIRFRPVELDRFALDRATSWFVSASRHATPSRPEPGGQGRGDT